MSRCERGRIDPPTDSPKATKDGPSCATPRRMRLGLKAPATGRSHGGLSWAERRPEVDEVLDQVMAGGPQLSQREELLRHIRAETACLVTASFRTGMAAGDEEEIDKLSRAQAERAVREAIGELEQDERTFVEDFYDNEQTLEQIAEKRRVAKKTAPGSHPRGRTAYPAR